ncbi:MAG: Eco57I restriction-modification methylase domain-containing protein [Desulfobacteraceae bacterium]|nr:Eco57I restriction-modification methylase domain-containing protein [Desulfobacteraceae bacterium]
MNTDTKQQIETALQAFSGADLRDATIGLLNSLGYQSEKTLDLDSTPDAFLAEFDKRDRKFRKDKALFDRWKSVEFLFQITDDEVRNAGAQGTLFDSGYDHGNYQSYLFFALDLKKNHYTRTQLADITREINLLFDMSAMLLIRHNGALTFSIIDRRLHKKDQSRDVLEKVKLIKDIRYQEPHRAHIEILHDLSLQALMSKHECRDFKQLHEAWRTTLDTNELNKKFYRRIQEWFFWAAQVVRFPHGGIDDEDLRNRTALIRLLTRIVFCWFAREKGLVHDELFDAKTPARVLKQFEPDSETDGSYYLAFLQNLFFPTLSVPLDQREFRNGRRYRGVNKHYMKHEFFRHEALFKYSDDLGRLFADIPFLNGGLFECLDTGTRKKDEVRVDGFSDVAGNQPMVPNILFFGREVEVDLSESYDSSKKSEVKVDGLFHILNAYKFTVAENTPIEEEIALDPELLGRIFENLLAEYNPETANTARKETGSFYTPRSIVDYMVDSSLKTYLKQILAEKRSMPEEDANVGLDILFSYTEKEHPFTESEKLILVDAIHDIKILDPACGSGAFPMGMLQKLVYVLEKLDHGHERWKQRIIDETPAEMREETRELLNRSSSDHNWKLGLIQRCIYGIDIQPIAVQIAKLRCFIALLVDFEVNEKRKNKGVPALPNLDFKFVAADTLVKPPGIENYAQNLLGLTESDPFFGKFAEATESYFFIRDPAVKRKLRVRIEALINEKICENESSLAGHRGDSYASEAIRKAISNKNRAAIEQTEREIMLWKSYRNIFAFHNQHVHFFDTRYFFPEANAGFDIVIGNPPYIQIQKFPKEKKDEWQAQGYITYAATANIYCLFYERGAQLLRTGGHLCYITSNKWMRAKYGESLRKYFSTKMNIVFVFDFGMAQNFGVATTYTCILELERAISKKQTVCCYAADDRAAMATPESYFQKNAVHMPELGENSWVVVTPERYRIKKAVEEQGVPLEEWDLNINYGIKTGLNDAFYLTQEQRDNLIAKEPQAEKIIVPLLRGRFVGRYKTDWDRTWIINAHNGVKKLVLPPVNLPDDYPVLFDHLKQWEKKLIKRQDKGDHWTNLRNCAYIEEFRKPKIIYPNMTKYLPFYYDEQDQFFGNQKCFIITSDNESLPYLTAMLNSSLFRCCFRDNFPELLGNTYELSKVFFHKIPIKRPDATTVSLFETLVDYIQFAKVYAKKTTSNGTPPAVIAAFLEELIDACVMEIYFADHVAEKKIAVIDKVCQAIKPLPRTASDSAKWQQIQSFYETVNAPEHPIRNRIMRIPIDSPDLLRVIKEEGKV